ncbi:MAG: hypothetical protein KJZ54_16150, partial [Phycisphaerales bacterium]|nr:hypothetical protein [Phycisphaerales bacterium]
FLSKESGHESGYFSATRVGKKASPVFKRHIEISDMLFKKHCDGSVLLWGRKTMPRVWQVIP